MNIALFPLYPSRLFGLGILFFLLPSLVQAQSISGHVIDLRDGFPLDQVQIREADSTIIGLSGRDGSFMVPLSSDSSLIFFHRPGYEDQAVFPDTRSGSIQVALAPRSLSLSEVRITGNSSARSNRETAGSVALLTGDRLRTGSGLSLQSSFNSVPGVQWDQSHLSESRLSIRGNGVRSPWGIRNIKIYLNEIPITEADGTSRLEAIDVQSLGSVEIIKGPASSLYGGGTGGVVRFQLQRAPYQEKSLEIGGLVGSNGLGRWTASFRHGGEKMNSYLSYGWQEYEGYREHSQDRRQFVVGNFQIFPNDKQRLTLILSHSAQASQIPGALTREQVEKNRRQAAPGQKEKQAGRNQQWTRFGLGHRYQFSRSLENSSSVYTYFYDLDHPLAFAYIRNFYQSLGGRTAFQFQSPSPSFPFRLIWGGEASQARTKGSQYQNQGGKEGPVMSNTDFRFHYYALFAQTEIPLHRHTLLTLGGSFNGLRYEVMDYLQPALSGEKVFAPALSPRVAISQFFSPAFHLHGSISSGYSPPSSAEIKREDGGVNPEIQAERGINYEMNLKGDFLSSRWTYELALFHQNMKGELIGHSVLQGITVYFNAGRTRHQGLEASLSWSLVREEDQRWISKLWILGSAAYSDFRFIDHKIRDEEGRLIADHHGHRLPGVAPWVAHGSLHWETRAGFYGNGQWHRKGKTPLHDENRDFMEGYSLVNAKLGYRSTLIQPLHFDLFLGVDNLTDTRYSSLISINAPSYGAASPAYFHPSPGPQFYLGLQLKYQL